VKAARGLLGFALAVLLARALGAEGYGIYAFVFSIVSILAVPAQLGLPHLLVRETARYRYQGNWGLLRGLLRWSDRIVISFSLGIGLASAAVAYSISYHTASVELNAFLYALALIPLVALGNVRGAALRGLGSVVQGQLPEMILRPGIFLVLVAASALFTQLTAPTAIALHGIAAGLAFFLGSMLLRRSLPPQAKSVDPRYTARDWISSVLPLSLLTGMLIVNTQTDVVMLGLLATTEDVGIYRAVAQLAMLVVFVFTAVDMVIAPYISQMYAARETERLQRLVTLSARAVLTAALPVAIAFLLFGETILAVVFGPDFGSGHAALAILCLGQLANAAAGSVVTLLNMAGHERDTAARVAIATVSNIILNLVLIPPFGTVGAAIASAVTLTLWNSLLCYQVWVRMGIQSMAFRLPFTRPNTQSGGGDASKKSG
jgi:O-antigen/teichoic acid export membrane protein